MFDPLPQSSKTLMARPSIETENAKFFRGSAPIKIQQFKTYHVCTKGRGYPCNKWFQKSDLFFLRKKSNESKFDCRIISKQLSQSASINRSAVALSAIDTFP